MGWQELSPGLRERLGPLLGFPGQREQLLW